MQSSIYQTGSKVILPAAIKQSMPTNYSEGQVCSSTRDVVRVKWDDGHEGNIKSKSILTKEKYEELVKAGMKIDQIIEYITVFNGHIYN